MLMKRMIGAVLGALLCVTGVPALAAGPEDAGWPDAVALTLSDSAVLADGEAVPEADESAAVYTAHDIVYYEAGQGFTYGEGTEADEHAPEEAQAHTVVHITAPGTYVLRGTLSAGQIAVDLGEDADSDPDAVVTLVLDGADVTCTVAPAVIFYNVYECDQTGDQGDAPDLADAGARIVIADGSENNISGSYVARIYKSYTLSDDGSSVVDNKKLHKYDGAFYSRMSMRVTGGSEGTGVLNITAANEGLDTEMHLAIDGGNINITSGNDGINVNEDGVSVVTVNGGDVHITVNGGTGEGDGIDSNGWLVVNGGSVTAAACADSADSGLDSENGIYLNGGIVIAAGNMLDPVTAPEQSCAVFSFSQRQPGGTKYALTGQDGGELLTYTAENAFTYLVMSSPALTPGEGYSLYAGEEQLAVSAGGAGMSGRFGPGGGRDMQPGEAPEPPDGMQPGQEHEFPDGTRPGEMPELPDGMQPGQAPELPDGTRPDQALETPPDGDGTEAGEVLFSLSAGLNQFRVSP